VRRLIGKGSDKLIPQLIARSDEAIAEWKKAIFMARYLPGVRAFPAVDLLLEKPPTTRRAPSRTRSAREPRQRPRLRSANSQLSRSPITPER
jgi:hypothetical protein